MCTIRVSVHIGSRITPPMRMGDAPVNSLGWIIFGIVALVIYTWNVIEFAANLAVHRMERQFGAAMTDEESEDDIIDRLDRMMGEKHDD